MPTGKTNARKGCLFPSLRAVAFVLLLTANAARGASGEVTLEEVWALNRMLDFNQAEKQLRRIEPRSDAGQHAVHFARAVTLLNVQPRSLRNVEEAYGLLEAIVSSGGESDLVAWALYYRGRIEQVHRAEPDAASALATYRELTARFPERIAAQLGFVKSALIQIYADPQRRSPAAALESLEREAVFLTSPFAKNQFHLIMADGYLFFHIDKRRALEHLVAARKMGSFQIVDLGSEYVRIANLAYELGERELALRSYRRFLEMRPKSSATFQVRERISELESRGPIAARQP